jgi:hypothetical protein
MNVRVTVWQLTNCETDQLFLLPSVFDFSMRIDDAPKETQKTAKSSTPSYRLSTMIWKATAVV